MGSNRACCKNGGKCATLYRLSSIAAGAAPQIKWRRDFFGGSLPSPPGNAFATGQEAWLWCGLDADQNCYHGGVPDRLWPGGIPTGPWWKKYDPNGGLLWSWTAPTIPNGQLFIQNAIVTPDGHSVLAFLIFTGDVPLPAYEDLAIIILDTDGNIVLQVNSLSAFLAANTALQSAAMGGWQGIFPSLPGFSIPRLLAANDNYVVIQAVANSTLNPPPTLSSSSAIVVLDLLTLAYHFLVADGCSSRSQYQFGPGGICSPTRAVLLEPGGLSEWLIVDLADYQFPIGTTYGNFVLAIDMGTAPTLHGGNGVGYALHWQSSPLFGDTIARQMNQFLTDGTDILCFGNSSRGGFLSLSSGAQLSSLVVPNGYGNWWFDDVLAQASSGNYPFGQTPGPGYITQLTATPAFGSKWTFQPAMMGGTGSNFWDTAVDEDGGSLWSGQEGCGVAIVPA